MVKYLNMYNHYNFFFSLSIVKITKLLILFFNIILTFSLKAQCPNSMTVTNGSTGTWVNTTAGVATVRITAVGAGGGKNTMISFPGDGQVNTLFGGSGANISGTFTIPAGATLLLIAGAAGNNSQNAGSGGGGSGVVYCGNPSNCGTGTILIIAGGGGGTSGFVAGNGGSASLSGNGSGGTNAGQNACGGGGINGAGQSGLNGATGGGQVNKTGLSLGGVAGTNNGFPGAAGGNGMGGGGASDGGAFAAGGGGHTGGNAENFTITAQGGLSINTGTSQSNVSGVNGGGANVGSVTIECLSILPVELIDFLANIQKDNTINLQWQTGSETNNKGFEIQRMTDNDLNWKSIGFVEGIGNSHSIRQYKYLDKFPFSGKNYYRLKQIDFDGREEFSKVIDAQIIEKIPSKIKVFPNPVMGGNINILIEEMEETHVIARLYNSVGQSVKTIRLTNGYNNIDVSDLQNGVYSLQTTIKNDVQILKVVISQ
jgi:hypothetical protein